MASTMGQHHHGLLYGFAAPLEMLMVPVGKGAIGAVSVVCDHLHPRSCSCPSDVQGHNRAPIGVDGSWG